MIRQLTFDDLAQIREWAWVLPSEKIGSAHDTMKAANLTARQWVTVYEQAANAANCATDALELCFDYRPNTMESNSDTVMIMTGRLLDELHRDVDSIGGVAFLKRVGKLINTWNKSMHRASVLAEVGTKDVATAALTDAGVYIRFVRSGLAALLDLDQNGRQKPRTDR